MESKGGTRPHWPATTGLCGQSHSTDEPQSDTPDCLGCGLPHSTPSPARGRRRYGRERHAKRTIGAANVAGSLVFSGSLYPLPAGRRLFMRQNPSGTSRYEISAVTFTVLAKLALVLGVTRGRPAPPTGAENSAFAVPLALRPIEVAVSPHDPSASGTAEILVAAPAPPPPEAQVPAPTEVSVPDTPKPRRADRVRLHRTDQVRAGRADQEAVPQPVNNHRHSWGSDPRQ
jgi:hypothetical protein